MYSVFTHVSSPSARTARNYGVRKGGNGERVTLKNVTKFSAARPTTYYYYYVILIRLCTRTRRASSWFIDYNREATADVKWNRFALSFRRPFFHDIDSRAVRTTKVRWSEIGAAPVTLRRTTFLEKSKKKKVRLRRPLAGVTLPSSGVRVPKDYVSVRPSIGFKDKIIFSRLRSFPLLITV